MPKYLPTEQDVYPTKSCPICGIDVLNEKSETCSDMCEMLWQYFKEVFERSFMEDLEKALDRSHTNHHASDQC
jgi:predicted nucleic acid-binding Zn ribbon protein